MKRVVKATEGTDVDDEKLVAEDPAVEKDMDEASEDDTEDIQMSKKPAAVAALARFARVLRKPAAAGSDAKARKDEKAARKQARRRERRLALKKPAVATEEAGVEDEPPAKKQRESKAVEEVVEEEEEKTKKATGKKKDQKKAKELQRMSATDLKELVASKGLEAGRKDTNIETMLAYYAQLREAEIEVESDYAQQREAEKNKVNEYNSVVSKYRKELSEMSKVDLKELCEKKGLKVSGSKEERTDRLVESAKAAGEFDRILKAKSRDSRRAELSAMEKGDLMQLCEKLQVDPFVKEVMVERILARENSQI
eukprot:TRINITY_DN10954_c0_g1_i1.p1 TRINITY_DN10954_c0_g1~~TRINITY_DN10954_c0_g1_i1.p1  ORF type:complete len:311 (+),score=97.76 TRINITY_DN10954_c0_g1_i1:113-1045(+)